MTDKRLAEIRLTLGDCRDICPHHPEADDLLAEVDRLRDIVHRQGDHDYPIGEVTLNRLRETWARGLADYASGPEFDDDPDGRAALLAALRKVYGPP